MANRKNEHLDIVLSGGAGPDGRDPTGLGRVVFEHVALPELAMAEIDLRCDFLGRALALPMMIGSMTGGPARAAAINATLAEVCEAKGIALAVGSQRVALEGEGDAGLGPELRRHAPTVPILANFGAVQLNCGFGIDQARRAVDSIGADALILHLNPLQEALQPEGDRDWRGLLARIGAIARALPVPVIVKEVGAGLSGAVVARLAEEGVAIFDVAGRGGTSWSKVEAARARDPAEAEIARVFADWGIPTAEAIVAARGAAPGATVIASGGLANGLQLAQALRLGADLGSFAGAILGDALAGPDALAARIDVIAAQLRIVCFCTGSADLAALRRARCTGVPPAE
ncbi:type 2 isopentenyl-diphosphate Delta-isomerase [Frigidibacter sp. MR17.24]|uniref:type 2 isopentenyl-diphosphate Delta-isomerase n=1 Tax=Frigidibacter sp. MR17.24 TaxID=3127345 RepID=UPI003012EB2C